MPGLLRPIALAVAALATAGCASIGYYAQSIGGHLDLMSRARPIEQVLADPALDPVKRGRLEAAQGARAFAVSELGLPDNGSYRQYAELGRQRVVWNVVATGEFSVSARPSCFPVVGCLTYRGYFDRAEAERQAAALNSQGMDVSVSGATAYSTLGWFADPLLNTMIERGEAEMVDVIFHELAHQRLYLAGDSAFNEAFATAVAQYGVRRWLEANGNPEAYADYAEDQARRRDFYAMLVAARGRLAQLYAMDLDRDTMRREKAAVFADLKLEYQDLKARWNGYGGYDRWMARDLNNAHLALVATYRQLVPAFLALIERHGGDLNAFYQAAAGYGALEREERHARLAALVPEGAGATLASAD